VPEGPRIVRVAEVPHDLGWGGANRVQDRLRCVRQLGDLKTPIRKARRRLRPSNAPGVVLHGGHWALSANWREAA